MKPDHVADLVKLRLEQARAAVEDARFLFQQKRSPQSVVNRAYYAMFYSALALLQTIGRVPSKHTGVLSLFDTEFVLKGAFPRDLSKDFHKAFDLRQVSDYEPGGTPTVEEAGSILGKAEQFVGQIEQYLQTNYRF